MFTPEVVRQPNTFASSQFRSFAVKGPKGRKGRKGQKAAVASPFELRHRLAAISDVVREKVPAWCNDALVGFGYRDPRGLRALRPLYRHDIGQYGRRQRGPCSLRLARSVGFQTRRKKQKEGLDDYDV
jgi:hypothetical protein